MSIKSGVVTASDEVLVLERLRKERDLYAGLLDLNLQSDPEPFLKSALDLNRRDHRCRTRLSGALRTHTVLNTDGFTRLDFHKRR